MSFLNSKKDQDLNQPFLPSPRISSSSLSNRNLPHRNNEIDDDTSLFDINNITHAKNSFDISHFPNPSLYKFRLIVTTFIVFISTILFFTFYSISLYRSTHVDPLSPQSVQYASSELCDKGLDKPAFLFSKKRRVGHGFCVQHNNPYQNHNQINNNNPLPQYQSSIVKPNWKDPTAYAKLQIIAIGDWGRDGFCCQHDVAAEINSLKKAWDQKNKVYKDGLPATNNNSSSSLSNSSSIIQWIVSLGDNFYPKGIQSELSPQVDSSWRNVYLSPYPKLASIAWMSVLGNHDYYGNPSAQFNIASPWFMPSRYYDKFLTVDSTQIHVVFLDSSPFYYQSTLAQIKMNISDLDIQLQLDWLSQTLAAHEPHWRIIVAHHPIYSAGQHAIDDKDNFQHMQVTLQPILDRFQVDLYIAGHDHNLQFIRNGLTAHVVSGAGSKTEPIAGKLNGFEFGSPTQGFLALQLTHNQAHLALVDLNGDIILSRYLDRNSRKK